MAKTKKTVIEPPTRQPIEIEHLPIDTLKGASYNPRTMPDASMKALMRGIEEFGVVDPIICNTITGNIVGGHQRWEAAKRLKLTHVPTVWVSLDEKREMALNLALNKISGDWDLPKLKDVLEELDDGAFDLELTGFSDEEIEALLTAAPPGVEGLTDPDDVPEVDESAPPVTKPGDLWILGEHRLLCGDSTKAEDVARVMGSVKADMVFTDPPYGVNIKGGKNAKETQIAGDLTQVAIPFSFDLAVTLATKDDARLYFCGGEGNLYLYQKLFEKHCRQLPRHLIWMKNHFVLKPNGYHNQYELIFHGYKPGGGSLDKWFGARTGDAASDVWQIHKDASSAYEHPTQKPVALAERAISNSCPDGGVVYEAFTGSGTTLIAAEQLNRKCYGLEISPQYCDVIVKRWQNFTGRQAVNEATGKTFDES